MEVYLWGKMVPFTLAVIHDILEIPRLNIRGKDDLQKSLGQHKQKKKLNLEARLWHQIIVTYLDPAQHDNTLSHSTAIMIWALMEEKRINLPPKDAVHKVHVGKPRYIPYGDWDEWGIQLKKRKKKSEAVPLNQLPVLVSKPPTPRRAPDLGYVVQLLHQVLQGQRIIDRRCQNIQRFLQHTFPDFDISQLDPVTPEHEPPLAERSEDFMDAEGGEDDDQDSEGGVDEAEYEPYRRATKPKEHPDDSTDTASED
ncbi:hypothetical protein PIB30_052035 [Stylosanthes scabra]|uniref:Uncharacterized protein n=1 Tax=Stylosanthes scabra TaxID=79078 RepID=A0ABU6RI31_9FABA|nr:hypothetical protein [Stylosanthes scabra]